MNLQAKQPFPVLNIAKSMESQDKSSSLPTSAIILMIILDSHNNSQRNTESAF